MAVGLNDKIVFSFMRVGHTRCMVDACLGPLRKRYRASDCDTVKDPQIQLTKWLGFKTDSLSYLI